mgnify:CR=1 FL=1
MIKTKTPRHWGGGIRQVSPPMLTSRLSNKRGGRTNGWKDYARSHWFCRNNRTAKNCIQHNCYDTNEFYTKDSACKRDNQQPLQYRAWFETRQRCLFSQRRAVYNSGRLGRQLYQILYSKYKRSFLSGNSPRLTLKGVA